MKRKEKRVKERYQCLMPVTLSLKEGVDGAVLAGPAKGVFSNISARGAALLIDRVAFGDYHLIESPLEDRGLILEIMVNDMAILCRPVWFHPAQYGGEERFRVGVSFLRPPTEDELQEMVSTAGSPDEEVKGWRKIVKKLLS